MNILIVDDSEIIRSRLIELLSEEPNVCIAGTATDFSSAMTMIATVNPDLIILDLVLKQGNGLQVLEALRLEGNRCKRIVITNYPTAIYRRRCLEEGADHFLDKSAEFHRIPELVRSMSAEPGGHGLRYSALKV